MIRTYLPKIPKSTEELIQWYERFISPLSLIFGFVVDNFFLLKRIDVLQTDLVFLFHLTLSASAIIFLNAVEGGRIKGLRALAIVPFAPVVVQFSFGGLFSGFVSLYSRSATYIGTWIFIAVLACLMVGNERFRKLYVRFSFQIALYFSALFLFFIFFLPVVLHESAQEKHLSTDLV